MNLSAAKLVKESAAQILYNEIKRIKWEATPRQLRGNTYAQDIIEQMDEASVKKRGVINIGKDLLFFCIDAVKYNMFIEIKMVDDERDCLDWYL